MRESLERLRVLIGSASYRFQNEKELQDGIAAVLARHGFQFRREVALSPEDRIDFLTSDGFGIEVKIGGGESALLRQCFRYMNTGAVSALLVVTSRQSLTISQGLIARKPFLNILVRPSL